MSFEQKVILKAVDNVSKETKAISNKMTKSFDSIRKESKSTKESLKGVSSGILSVKTAVIALSAIATGKLVQSFIKAGSEVEDLTTEFKVLLGSVEDAKNRMGELEKFAQTTPFQLSQVAKASKVLETFTKGALSTGDSLRMVGDAAAITAEKDFAGLAMWVGRAYDGLQNNRPIGEAMMRLQELALVSGAARGKIEELQKAGKGKQAWKVLETELKKAKGGMSELSKTATGLSSTIKDQVSAAMREMMKSGAWDAWKNVLDSVVSSMNKALENGTFERWGRNIANLTDGVMDIADALGILDKQVKGEGFLNNKSEIANVRKLINELDLLKSQHKAIGEEMKKLPASEFSKVSMYSKESAKTFSEIESVTKRLNGITGEWFDKQVNVGKSTGEILDLLNQTDSKLKTIGGSKSKVSDIIPMPSKSDLKGQSLDYQQVMRDAAAERASLQYEIDEMLLSAQMETREREISEEELHLAKMLDIRFLDAEKKKEFDAYKEAAEKAHRANISRINTEWDEKEGKAKSKTLKEQAKDTKKIEKLDKLRVDSNLSVTQSYISAASNIGSALGIQGKALQKFALAESLIQIPRAYLQALTNPPGPPGSIPQATAAGILAGSKSALIASQSFHTGGMVEVPAKLLPGEGVLSHQGMRNAGGVGTLNSLNNSTPPASPNNVEIIYSPTQNITSTQNENMIDILRQDKEQFFNLIKEGKQRGYL